jgi:hypothetical protein
MPDAPAAPDAPTRLGLPRLASAKHVLDHGVVSFECLAASSSTIHRVCGELLRNLAVGLGLSPYAPSTDFHRRSLYLRHRTLDRRLRRSFPPVSGTPL